MHLLRLSENRRLLRINGCIRNRIAYWRTAGLRQQRPVESQPSWMSAIDGKKLSPAFVADIGVHQGDVTPFERAAACDSELHRVIRAFAARTAPRHLTAG
jgi:hypothetical protein